METEKLIEEGKIICSRNPFYETLSLLLKYFFCDNSINIMDIIKNVTKTELEFQTFMIYKNYALDLYYSHKQYVEDISYDNTVYFIISLVKNNYDKNRNVISPYVFSIETNKDDIIEKYHYVKSIYSVKNENIEKMNNLNKIINLLEEAKLYDKKANDCRNNAMKLLYNVKETYTTNSNLPELKLLKL
jgi:hypothetical protein